jgi:hypothetical protein
MVVMLVARFMLMMLLWIVLVMVRPLPRFE